MLFVRRLTLIPAQHQFILRPAHIPDHHSSIADSSSCFSFQKFRLLAPESDLHPTPVPPFSASIFNEPLSWQIFCNIIPSTHYAPAPPSQLPDRVTQTKLLKSSAVGHRKPIAPTSITILTILQALTLGCSSCTQQYHDV